jgi:cytoskeletal protein CcmA (bactofilin family)
MFNKTSKPTTTPEVRTPPIVTPPVDVSPSINLNKVAPVTTSPMRSNSNNAAKGLSSFGAGLVIEGNITGAGDLVLEGTVHGDVKVSHLTVGESGNIEGKVEADTVEVRGRVVGSIKGTQVKLQATAYVEGDITHEQLAIDVGAYFQGRCLQTRPAPSAPASVAPANAAPAAQPVAAQPTVAQPSASSPAPVAAGGPSLGSYDANALADLK